MMAYVAVIILGRGASSLYMASISSLKCARACIRFNLNVGVNRLFSTVNMSLHNLITRGYRNDKDESYNINIYYY